MSQALQKARHSKKPPHHLQGGDINHQQHNVSAQGEEIYAGSACADVVSRLPDPMTPFSPSLIRPVLHTKGGADHLAHQQVQPDQSADLQVSARPAPPAKQRPSQVAPRSLPRAVSQPYNPPKGIGYVPVPPRLPSLRGAESHRPENGIEKIIADEQHSRNALVQDEAFVLSRIFEIHTWGIEELMFPIFSSLFSAENEKRSAIAKERLKWVYALGQQHLEGLREAAVVTIQRVHRSFRVREGMFVNRVETSISSRLLYESDLLRRKIRSDEERGWVQLMEFCSRSLVEYLATTVFNGLKDRFLRRLRCIVRGIPLPEDVEAEEQASRSDLISQEEAPQRMLLRELAVFDRGLVHCQEGETHRRGLAKTAEEHERVALYFTAWIERTQLIESLLRQNIHRERLGDLKQLLSAIQQTNLGFTETRTRTILLQEEEVARTLLNSQWADAVRVEATLRLQRIFRIWLAKARTTRMRTARINCVLQFMAFEEANVRPLFFHMEEKRDREQRFEVERLELSHRVEVVEAAERKELAGLLPTMEPHLRHCIELRENVERTQLQLWSVQAFESMKRTAIGLLMVNTVEHSCRSFVKQRYATALDVFRRQFYEERGMARERGSYAAVSLQSSPNAPPSTIVSPSSIVAPKRDATTLTSASSSFRQLLFPTTTPPVRAAPLASSSSPASFGFSVKELQDEERRARFNLDELQALLFSDVQFQFQQAVPTKPHQSLSRPTMNAGSREVAAERREEEDDDAGAGLLTAVAEKGFNGAAETEERREERSHERQASVARPPLAPHVGSSSSSFHPRPPISNRSSFSIQNQPAAPTKVSASSASTASRSFPHSASKETVSDDDITSASSSSAFLVAVTLLVDEENAQRRTLSHEQSTSFAAIRKQYNVERIRVKATADMMDQFYHAMIGLQQAEACERSDLEITQLVNRKALIETHHTTRKTVAEMEKRLAVAAAAAQHNDERRKRLEEDLLDALAAAGSHATVAVAESSKEQIQQLVEAEMEYRGSVKEVEMVARIALARNLSAANTAKTISSISSSAVPSALLSVQRSQPNGVVGHDRQPIEQESATRIQAAWRGHEARRDTDLRREQQELANRLRQLEEQAAQSIAAKLQKNLPKQELSALHVTFNQLSPSTKAQYANLFPPSTNSLGAATTSHPPGQNSTSTLPITTPDGRVVNDLQWF